MRALKQLAALCLLQAAAAAPAKRAQLDSKVVAHVYAGESEINFNEDKKLYEITLDVDLFQSGMGLCGKAPD